MSLAKRATKSLLIAIFTTSVLTFSATSSADEYYDEYYDDYIEDYGFGWDVWDFYFGDPLPAEAYETLMEHYAMALDLAPTDADYEDYYELWMIAYGDTFGVGAPHEGDMTEEEATNIFLGLDDYYIGGPPMPPGP